MAEEQEATMAEEQEATMAEEQEATEYGSPEQRSSHSESRTEVVQYVDSGTQIPAVQISENATLDLSNQSLHVRSASTISRPSTPPGFYCRICHDRNLEERNISPCYCRGTLGLVHLGCLQNWLLISDTTHCEICGYQYNVNRVPKYSVLKSIVYWYTQQRSTEEGRKIIKAATSLVSEAPVVFSLNYLWLTKVDMVLAHMDDYANDFLSFYDFQEHLMLTARLINIFLVSPMGVVSGCHLMVFFIKIFNLLRIWYLWHRKECNIVIQLENRPNPTSSSSNSSE